MKFDQVEKMVGDVPFISKHNARILYEFILNNNIGNILELGIAHGSATCYMAAALQELSKGHITAVDLVEAATCFKPSAEEQLAKTGLSDYVRIERMQTGYSWFLHDEIRRNTIKDSCREVYDLCIIDGPKNWTIDGGAFFLVDKLMKKNGWLIFDDYKWTYAAADARRAETDGITHRLLSKAEQETPHIQEVYELLVKQHPHYGDFAVVGDGDWVVARKLSRDSRILQKVRKVIRKIRRYANAPWCR